MNCSAKRVLAPRGLLGDLAVVLVAGAFTVRLYQLRFMRRGTFTPHALGECFFLIPRLRRKYSSLEQVARTQKTRTCKLIRSSLLNTQLVCARLLHASTIPLSSKCRAKSVTVYFNLKVGFPAVLALFVIFSGRYHLTWPSAKL